MGDELPRILEERELLASDQFRVQQRHLEFADGQRRHYERLPAVGAEAVMVVALDPQGDLLLVREYAAGLHRWQLSLPKGSTAPGETLEAAAQRELREETGCGAATLVYLRRLLLAPSHMAFSIHVVLAMDLYAAPLTAPEPLAPVCERWPLARLGALLARPDFDEARALAALLLARERLRAGPPYVSSTTPATALAYS